MSWTGEESNDIGGGFPLKRRIQMGTTLVIDWESKQVLSLLTTNHEQKKRQEELEQQQIDRGQFLKNLWEADLLRLEEKALGPDGKLLNSVIHAEIQNEVLRVHNASKMLHIAGVNHG